MRRMQERIPRREPKVTREAEQRLNSLGGSALHHYDRAGRPIGIGTWARLHGLPSYLRLARSMVGEYLISTVWLGTDHGFGRGPPIIFESMVAKPHPWNGERHPGFSRLPEGNRAMLAVLGKRIEDASLGGSRWWVCRHCHRYVQHRARARHVRRGCVIMEWEIEMDRYATEAEAYAGHARLVKKYRAMLN